MEYFRYLILHAKNTFKVNYSGFRQVEYTLLLIVNV
jgi:hypothetical protein